MIPNFAVVGRSNKGKSSIVATLTENDQIDIAPTPRTTQVCQPFTLKLDGQSLFTIIDTPGFEEAPAVLEWLKAVPLAAHQRPERVRAFLKHFAGGERFPYERQLLEPIMQGAAVLYVVDASRPYRPNYEAEFEILLWTGQASMALINQISQEDHLNDWRHALNQYFKLVKVFNAHQAYFEDRLRLLEEMRVIHEPFRAALDRAIAVLKRHDEQRMNTCALSIAELIAQALSFQLRVKSRERPPTESEKLELVERFHDELRQLEKSSRRSIMQVFNYHQLKTEETELDKPIYDTDLFSQETWELLGLTRSQLISFGTAAGALAGGSLDAMVGGASILLGTGLGALIGGVSSTYLALTDPKVAGFKISQTHWLVGPHQNQNLPWVLLDRSLSFVRALLHRTHAQQTTLILSNEAGKSGASSHFSSADLRSFAWQFRKLRWGLQKAKALNELSELIKKHLTAP